MPLVQITMLQGRTAEQKRNIAKRITDALVEEAGARREGVIGWRAHGGQSQVTASRGRGTRPHELP